MSLSLVGRDDNKNEIKILGVCGGIGSGKSTACQLLVSELNCLDHIDADKIAHSVYAPGSEGVQAIVREFGDSILLRNPDTGELQIPYEIHRPSLGNIVFNDASAMKRLEQIVWPLTKQFVQDKIQIIIDNYYEQHQQDQQQLSDQQNTKLPIIIIEAAMLLDADWHEQKSQGFLDAVWVVTTGDDNDNVAIQRLMETRDLSREEAIKRINAQKVRRGIGNNNLQKEIQNNVVTAVIKNDGTLEELKQALAEKLNDSQIQWYSKKKTSMNIS